MGLKTQIALPAIGLLLLNKSTSLEAQLTVHQTCIHVAIIVGALVMFVFPIESNLAELGFSLSRLINCFVSKEDTSFLKFAFLNIKLHYLFLHTIPLYVSLYFVHGNHYYTGKEESRFVGIFNHPLVFQIILLFCSIALVIRTLKFEQKTSVRNFLKRLPMGGLQIDEEMVLVNSPPLEIYMGGASNISIYFTSHYFVYTSNFGVSLSRIEDISMSIVEYVTTVYDEMERNCVAVDVTFAEDGMDPLRLSIIAQDFKKIFEKNNIRLHIPPEIKIPSYLVYVFANEFRNRISLNKPVRYNGPEQSKECYACQLPNRKVLFVKTCDGHRIGYERTNGDVVVTGPCKSGCKCEPHWCVDCIGKVFAPTSAQSSDAWMDIIAECPFCRRNYCIEDIHLVAEDGDEAMEYPYYNNAPDNMNNGEIVVQDHLENNI